MVTTELPIKQFLNQTDGFNCRYLLHLPSDGLGNKIIICLKTFAKLIPTNIWCVIIFIVNPPTGSDGRLPFQIIVLLLNYKR